MKWPRSVLTGTVKLTDLSAYSAPSPLSKLLILHPSVDRFRLQNSRFLLNLTIPQGGFTRDLADVPEEHDVIPHFIIPVPHCVPHDAVSDTHVEEGGAGSGSHLKGKDQSIAPGRSLGDIGGYPEIGSLRGGTGNSVSRESRSALLRTRIWPKA